MTSSEQITTHKGAKPALRTLRAGWALSGFVGLFLLFDGGARLAGFAPYVEGMTKFGYPASLAPAIGLLLLVCTILMLVPRTAVLGNILVTGYLGGAVATQVRVGDPWYLFPVVMGALAWLGLYLRDARVRALIPIRTERTNAIAANPPTACTTVDPAKST